ncbi:2-succinyl-5-enolpyruvyl-6-hydroxy-3-cyclohexene-1-carboxylate synthase [Robiginitalea aurantiaca]|uniref:2-succinyl-5-enolpyruvyl-6-hydroxy-3-cyclohexene-1-carboxylate synthase n=1 Tax=Robiginitalea aurantiaca TaxID=3056915 RepID=A0ABT7WGF6_9FLAO|nr:2-succinyl-5-enolpyruvyl-6-hydroxy-3-cyclohexene-1-carboxylate synthase [Robiginitalea aurantiaca]MDM9631899.1 thiamine pyrophosphate-binding protein [Robiginitalea aurantiaca]
MKYSSIPVAHTLVSLFKFNGIQQVVISPGSRNAPLILAFSQDPYFRCYSIVDERSAAFFALGLAQQSGKPAVLLCTSGSALLNYYPAVAEGYYSRIPMVILSADRPEYKIDIGDGQTIRQNGVFEKHIGFQAALGQDVTHATEAIRWEAGDPPENARQLKQMQDQCQSENENLICMALKTALNRRLPVHLNVPFEEPLYNMQDEPPVNPSLSQAAESDRLNPDWTALRNKWEGANRKMILIGVLPPASIQAEILEVLGQDPSVMVFTETTSNVHHPQFFPSIDSILAPIEKTENAEAHYQNLRPDVLLTLGGMVVSKKIKQFLRRYKPQTHWHIDPYSAPDTYYSLDGHVQMGAGDFFREFLPSVKKGVCAYKAPWLEVMQTYRNRRKAYLNKIPFTDFHAFHQVLQSIPPGVQVQLANSSTVRYSQLFEMGAENAVYCNRGTSGIEGSTSTAVGASVNSEQPTLLLTGDLSFFYDINGLWNNYIKADFRIIVLNNGGGGIFRILPGKTENPDFETYFETVQHRSIEALCKAFGIGYALADDSGSLGANLKTFYKPTGSPELLEIKTPRKLNDTILLDYFDFLSWSLPINQ